MRQMKPLLPMKKCLLRHLTILTAMVAVFGSFLPDSLAGPPFPELVHPVTSGGFDEQITVLKTGNLVATDSFRGAIYLFNGATGALISTATFAPSAEFCKVWALENGHFVCANSKWNNGLGFVIWGNGTTGVSGVVSSANSLVGSKANDGVGHVVKVLKRGGFVVMSPRWDNGTLLDAGALTFGNGAGPITGAVSASNSLVGSDHYDYVGNPTGAFLALSNGSFVAVTPFWDHGAIIDAGAVTWGSASAGVTGVISAANSLVGGRASDRVGEHGIFEVGDSNYVVASNFWANGAVVYAGAVTWGSGSTGVSGVVSSGNSLVGSVPNDMVGRSGITILTNGNYLVRSMESDQPGVTNAGAVTWGSGLTGVSGVVTSANSLVGAAANDQIGSGGITALSNGNYVVSSPLWNHGAVVDAGAATFGSGTSGVSGVVSEVNSLVGDTAGDSVSSKGVVALTGGNYVVCSPAWDEDATQNVGAVTWANGLTGISGFVSSANSLLGAVAADQIGSNSVVALSNGAAVALSPSCRNGAVSAAGAVTWMNGSTGLIGRVTAANSLMGSRALDSVGTGGATALTNGSYVVLSPSWDSDSATNVGAATWCSGDASTSATVSAGNSLVGTTANDFSAARVTPLSNGNFLLVTPQWDHGAATNAGAVTFGIGTSGMAGSLNSGVSLVGSATLDALGTLPESITELANGNYLVSTPKLGAHPGGAITWGSGITGVSGAISAMNSLVGAEGEVVGKAKIIPLSNGHFLVYAEPIYSNTLLAYTSFGTVSFRVGTSAATGSLIDSNTIIGTSAHKLIGLTVDDSNNTYLARVMLGSQLDGLAPNLPEIDVTGGYGLSIAIGDVTPDSIDHTNFGRTTAAGGTVVRTFTIKNTGTSPLHLNGTPLVQITGANVSDFTVTSLPTTPLAARTGSSSFGITFAPATSGVKSATVTVASTDADEPAYTFAIKGEGRTVVNTGDNWVEQPGSGDRQWTRICSSADGMKIAAAVSAGQIYTSTDGGVSWTARDSNRSWNSISCSDDGTRLVATVNGGLCYFSTDSGLTWTPRGDTRSWFAACMSADGSIVYAVVTNGWIFRFTDDGMTQSPMNTTNRGWRGVACSADGTKIAACATGDFIYTSPDSGITWTQRAVSHGWKDIVSSADGRVLAAFPSSQQIHVSTDYGVTWTPRDSNRGWVGLACSADGTRMAAAVAINGRIYISTDSGTTWTPKASLGNWTCVTSSADGTKLVAAVGGNAVWTSTGALDPVMSMRGNDTVIITGDTTPDLADHTDFGSVSASAGHFDRTFKVKSIGPLPLLLTGSPQVIISGPNAADFSVTTAPAASLPAITGSSDLIIRFDPSALGLRTATVSIESDDPAHNPYTFTIAGTGVAGSHAVTPAVIGSGSISPAVPQSVVEGGSVTFTATADAGHFIDRWLVNGVQTQLGGSSLTIDAVTSVTSVTVVVTQDPQAPVIVTQPQSQLVLRGAAVDFAPGYSGSLPISFQWRKGATSVGGATGPAFSITAVADADAAEFRVATANSVAGPILSQPAYIGVVVPAPATLTGRLGSNMVMTCTAKAPSISGVSLAYQWLLDGNPLTPGTQANGSVIAMNLSKSSMTIQKLAASSKGTYTCRVTMITPGNDPVLTHGDTELVIVDEQPVMNAIPLPATMMVSQGIDVTLSATNAPTGFTVTSLPAGLKMDAITGRITGKPTVASKKDTNGNPIPTKITFRAKNLWSQGPAVDFNVIIQPLDPSHIGTFNGIITRSRHTNQGLGGHVQFTVSTTGVFSGYALLAGTRYNVNGTLNTSPGNDPTAQIQIVRTPALGRLEVPLNIVTGDHLMQGRIFDPRLLWMQAQIITGDPAQPDHFDGPLVDARLDSPRGLIVAADGSGYIADTANHAIRRFDPASGTLSTFAGGLFEGSVDAVGIEASFDSPEGLAFDAAGSLLVADTGNGIVRQVTPAGEVTTLVDASAGLVAPCGLCFDPAGNLYITDRGAHCVAKLTPAGVVSTFAGLSGTSGNANGSGTTARFSSPGGIGYDPVSKALFVADTGNRTIRKITLAGAVTTFAGSPGVAGDDDGILANSRFGAPAGIMAHHDGTLFVSDGPVIRQITPAGLVITVTAPLQATDHPAAVAWDASTSTLLAVDDALHALVRHTPGAALDDATFAARRNPWTSTNTVPTAEQGGYNAALETTAAPTAIQYPQGHGYARVVIGSNGSAAWTCRAADGTDFTFGTFLAGDRSLPLHATLYGGTGSLQGECFINSTTLDLVNDVTPNFDWYKIARPLSHADRSYKTGFPVHSLEMFGGKHTPGNLHSYLGLSASPATLEIDFGSFQQPFSLASPNALTVPANARKVTLSIAPATGIYTGTYREGSPAVTIPFAGILIDYEAGSTRQGYGHFLPRTSVSTSPVESAPMVLELP